VFIAGRDRRLVERLALHKLVQRLVHTTVWARACVCVCVCVRIVSERADKDRWVIVRGLP
jgi:hypothetical protein